MAQYDPYGLPLNPNNSWAAYQGAAGQEGAQAAAAPATSHGYAASYSETRRSHGFRAANMLGEGQASLGYTWFGPIFGDTFTPTGMGVGGRYGHIGENNKAFTMDRAYFTYHYQHNAVPVSLSGAPFVNHSINKYVFGAEKSFANGLASVEVRGEMLNDVDAFGADTAFDTGIFGNTTVNLKLQLYEGENFGLVGGVGMGAPTGSDFDAYLTTTGTSFSVDNRAYYVLPFIGATYAPTESLFGTTFVQVATAASGDRLLVDDVVVGKVTSQTTIHVSTSIGAWIIDEDDGYGIKGLAWLNEFHYTTALQDPDNVLAFGPFGETINVASSGSRYSLLHVTSGVHLQLSELMSFRVAGVFPIRDGGDRTYDAQVLATFNKEF